MANQGFTNLLQILAGGAQGAMQGYDQGLAMQEQKRQQERQAAQDAAQAEYRAAQLANWQADNARQEANAKALAEQREADNARGLLGTLLQNKQYEQANTTAQASPILRQLLGGLSPEQQGPANVAFAPPPVEPKPLVLSQGQVAKDPTTGKTIAEGKPKTFAPPRPSQPRLVANEQGVLVPATPGLKVKQPATQKPKTDDQLWKEANRELPELSRIEKLNAKKVVERSNKVLELYNKKKRQRDSGGKSALDRLLED